MSHLSWTQLLGDGHDVDGGGANGGVGGLSHAAHVPGGEHALQGPQHDDNQHNDQHNENQQSLSICHSANPSQAVPVRLRWCVHRFTGSNVNADAQGRGTVRGVLAGHASGTFVAQLFPFQPHGLRLLLVVRESAQDFAACGQSWGSLVGDRGGLTAERAGEVHDAAADVGLALRHHHQAGEALQAEGVGAVQQFGRLEDVVVGVVADGALRLTHRCSLLKLQVHFLGVEGHVPNRRRLLHVGQRPALTTVQIFSGLTW